MIHIYIGNCGLQTVENLDFCDSSLLGIYMYT
jgi:hypothetical protein